MTEPTRRDLEEVTAATTLGGESQAGRNKSFPEPLRAAIREYYFRLPENVKINIGVLSQLLFSEDETLSNLAHDILANSEKATQQVLEKLGFTRGQKHAVAKEACIAGLAVGLLLARE